MPAAAVIRQVGHVEMFQMPEDVPYYIRLMRPTHPMTAYRTSNEVIQPTSLLDLTTIKLIRHRVIGFSVRIAYWPDSWQDAWAIEELLKWEGRENEINREHWYADFIIDENQQANPNERLALESEPVRTARGGDEPMVLVVHESVPRRGVDAGANVLGRSESDNMLRLERSV
jgi:hypothetical protein